MFKVVWIAGMPRSGSMWTFNVVRELYRRAGFRVLPEEIRITDQEWANYANREITANRDPNTIFVLKLHAYLQNTPPDNLVITNIRDVRDALMSYMRFMHVDFETALGATKSTAGIADHYVGFPEDRRMVLRYDELTAKPAAMVAAIADRLGIQGGQALAENVADQFSREKVQVLTKDKDQRIRQAVANGEPLVGEILIERADGNPVTIDRTTGFQSDHVSSYQDGSWRQLLSCDQIDAMDQALGPWLMRHGYAV